MSYDTDISPQQRANNMLADLTDYCLEYGIPIKASIGYLKEYAVAETQEMTSDCSNLPSNQWRRESLNHIFTGINHRICEIAGKDPNTMDRELYHLFITLVDQLAPIK
jgi:hypothetical protein